MHALSWKRWVAAFAARAALVVTLAVPLSAEVRLPAVFGDHMVLQHGTEAAIWGWAEPGETVRVRASWLEQAVEATADDAGRWRVRLKTGEPGGPHTVTINGGGEITLSDVLLGEVWVCSGQSNMEWSVGPHVGPGIANHAQEIAAAEHPQIRLFTVAKARAAQPAEDVTGAWQVCSPETVRPFSATAYFFGRALHQELRRPVGLIASSWGGTEIELWTSEAAMRRVPALARKIDARPRLEREHRAALDAWRERVQAADPGWGKWQSSDAETRNWEPLERPTLWSAHGLGGFDGIVWYRAEFELPAGAAGQAVMLELGAIDDADVTWVNGQRVGETESWAAARRYPVDAGSLRAGRNVVVVRVHDFVGEGGFHGGTEPAVVVGDRRAGLTGWSYRRSVEQKALPPRPRSPVRENSTLYNAMIAPLTPLAIRGVIWYQGESNVFRTHQYRTSFPLMIEDWRAAWGRPELPFYYVQIAPFDYRRFEPSAASENWPHPSAELRDAQLAALRVPHTGMVVTTDITADVSDIHPPNKQDVGRRLALWALAGTYGRQGLVYSGPIYRAMSIEGASVRIEFDHADGGLIARGGELTHFTIAGADRVFHPAEARTDGETVIVSSPRVAEPAAVRFGWSDTAMPNLFNEAGLPASPFRTDDWPTSTADATW